MSNTLLSCQDIIDKRCDLWYHYKDSKNAIEKDLEYRQAVSDKLIESIYDQKTKKHIPTPQAKKLQKEIQSDPSLLIEMVFVIDDKNGETVPFFLNKAQSIVQQEYRDCLKENIPFRAIIPKGRQQGISSWITSLQLVKGIITKNFQGYTVADEDKSTNNLFEKAKSYYGPLPGTLKPTEKYNNRKEFRWAKDDGSGMNSSWGISTAGNTSKKGRVGNSFTMHFLHASEVAWWENIDKTLSGLTDACTPTADIVLESTGNGYNEFQERCDKARTGKSDYKLIFIPWYIQNEYRKVFRDSGREKEFLNQIKTSNRKIFQNLRNYKNNIDEITLENLWWYYRKFIDDKNEDLAEMQQEYPTFLEEAFQSSGNPAFNIDNVKDKLMKTKKQSIPIAAYNAIPIVKERTNNIREKVKFDYIKVQIDEDREWEKADILVFEEPKKGHVYCCGADVAEGTEKGDYSSASIWSINSWKQAVQIHGHWEADEYAYMLYDWGKKYGWAYMGIEYNNMGSTTNNKLYKDLNYPRHRFHHRTDETRRDEKESRKIGWWTGNNKFLMIDEFRTAAINSSQMVMRDWQTFSECMTYVRDEKGSYNAESGKFDDRIMDKAIAWQLRKFVTRHQVKQDTYSNLRR